MTTLQGDLSGAELGPSAAPQPPLMTPAEASRRFNLSSWTLQHQSLVVFLIGAGSIWIMDHLNQNMMPMEQMMEMQR